MSGTISRLVDRAEKRDTGYESRMTARVGAFVVSRFQASFEDQGIGGHEWPARAALSVPAIVPDLKKGPHIQPVWFEMRPAGVGPGQSTPHITYVRRGYGEIEAGSWEPYASEMQRGTERDVTITSTVKRNIWTYMGSTSGKKARVKALGKFYAARLKSARASGDAARIARAESGVKKAAFMKSKLRPAPKGTAKRLDGKQRSKLAWIARQDSIHVTIPARPFVVLTDEAREKIKQIAIEELFA